ncbi:MAG: hypothetical protein JO131_07130, partial [Gammaproteobacteria bacterium]|nr:hypothetical protein [Gammaproteobacteria bacterium]
TTKITKNRRRLNKILTKFNKKIKVKKLSFKLNTNNKKLNGLRFSLFNLLNYKYIYGFRLEGKGRLTKRYTASRSKSIHKYKGNLANIYSSFGGLSSIMLKNNLKSNLQFTKLKSKTRIGSFGIKG